MFDTFGPDVVIKKPDPADSSIWRRLRQALVYRLKSMSIQLRKALLALNLQKVPLDIVLFDLEEANYRALRAYRPKSYNGHICVIRARLQEKGWYSDPLMGWGQVVKGKIDTYQIEGTHYDFIERPELVTILRQLL